MAGALSKRRRQEDAPYWPGFVDAMAQLLLVITFLLSVFMTAQFLLAREISGQDFSARAIALADCRAHAIAGFGEIRQGRGGSKPAGAER